MGKIIGILIVLGGGMLIRGAVTENSGPFYIVGGVLIFIAVLMFFKEVK